MVHEPDIAVIEAVIGSDLYSQALRLREAILREPLSLTITEEELATLGLAAAEGGDLAVLA